MAKAKTLTAAELRRATDYIATRPHAARNRAMLLTTHLAGLRVGEVALLSWSDAVDTSGQVREEIRLNADQTKGRHPRTVYISPKLRKELQAYVTQFQQDHLKLPSSIHRSIHAEALRPTRLHSCSLISIAVLALKALAATVVAERLQHP